MAVRLDLHPEAVAEARAAREWYAARSELAALAFLAELDLAVARIQGAPQQWPRYIQDTRRYLMKRFPFFVVYRKLDDTIQLVAVAHARRRPGYWRVRKD
jgi:plasmid stabilization system protein ParE